MACTAFRICTDDFVIFVACMIHLEVFGLFRLPIYMFRWLRWNYCCIAWPSGSLGLCSVAYFFAGLWLLWPLAIFLAALVLLWVFVHCTVDAGLDHTRQRGRIVDGRGGGLGRSTGPSIGRARESLNS